MGIELSKQQQQTNWASPNLTQKQLEYAASDVYYLIEIYHHLEKMMSYRPPLPSGKTVNEINDIAQKFFQVWFRFWSMDMVTEIKAGKPAYLLTNDF